MLAAAAGLEAPAGPDLGAVGEEREEGVPAHPVAGANGDFALEAAETLRRELAEPAHVRALAQPHPREHAFGEQPSTVRVRALSLFPRTRVPR
jgi:hypothetical protein